jgi:hypothetical protein
MVTLSQIEPRTPISSAPYTISQPGSYYLATNLTVASGNAITINANGVTLDLNGFTIFSTAASATGTAVLFNGALTNIAIYNGQISSGVTNNSSNFFGGSGFDNGINGNDVFNIRVKNVSVSGCLDNGIYLGYNSSLVEGCTVNTMGGIGITAQSVSDSTVLNCGYAGIDAQMANNCSGLGYYYGINANTANNCYGSSIGNSTDYGLSAVTADNCYGSSNGSGYGIQATTANNCYGYNTGGGYGLIISGSAIGCYGYSSSGIGIDAYIANSCYSNTGDGSITYKYNMP